MAERVRRGEVWSIAGGGDYTGKPRPAVVIQDDLFETPASVTMCPFTTEGHNDYFFRIEIEPSVTNGLRATSFLMVDKITTVNRSRCRSKIGTLAAADVMRLERAMVVFLGLAKSSSRRG